MRDVKYRINVKIKCKHYSKCKMKITNLHPSHNGCEYNCRNAHRQQYIDGNAKHSQTWTEETKAINKKIDENRYDTRNIECFSMEMELLGGMNECV